MVKLGALIASLVVGMAVMGFQTKSIADSAVETEQEQTHWEQQVRIIEPVVWAITHDKTGETMKRFCGFSGGTFTEQQTQKGSAYIKCRGNEERVDIWIEGRRYASDVPIIYVNFTMEPIEGVWRGPRYPDYRPYKRGPGVE